MYICVNSITKNKAIACISATLYMLMPYHLNDMYIRNALGEFLSYIFIPLVFAGVYRLLNKEKNSFLLCIGTVRIITYT